MPRHILIKLTKTKHKERLLKAAREKQQVTYKGHPICLTADFSAETLQARREWHDIFKVMKGKNLRQRVLYPTRLSFRFDREIKSNNPSFKSQFFHIEDVEPRASSSTTLNLHFLVWKIRVRIYSSHEVNVRIKWEDRCKRLSWRPSIHIWLE